VQIFVLQSSINSARKIIYSKKIKTLVNLNRRKKYIETISKYKNSNSFKSLQIKYIIFNLIINCKLTLYINL
jgi:chorismate mutase